MRKRFTKSTGNVFASGFIAASASFIVIFLLLILSGFIGFKKNYNNILYADSLAPRKTLPKWYTIPTPDPNALDKTAPTVSITTPTDGVNVETGSAVYVEVSASDNDRIAHLAMYLNDILDGLVYADLTAYKVTVRIPSQRGPYVIKAIVYDYAGNSSSSSITVNAVKNLP